MLCVMVEGAMVDLLLLFTVRPGHRSSAPIVENHENFCNDRDLTLDPPLGPSPE